MMKTLMLAASALVLASACTPAAEGPVETATNTAAPGSVDLPDPAVRFAPFGLDASGMNTNVKPGDDFFMYMHGTWAASYEIPADKSRTGSFDQLADLSELRVKAIVEELVASAPAVDTLSGKIAAYYAAYLDTAAIEARGLEPVKPYLDRINAITTREDLARLFGSPDGYDAPLGAFVDIDSKQTDRHITYMNQSGLGLPDRDNYLKDDARNTLLRDSYREYVRFLLTQAGHPDPATGTDQVMALETKIAQAFWDRTLGRNRDLTYNLLTRDQLVSLAGEFPINAMLDEAGLGSQQEFVLRQMPPSPEALAALTLTDDMRANLTQGGLPALMQIAATEPLDSWKAYLTVRFLSDHASVLPAAFDEASFNLYGKVIRGQPQQRDRWKRAIGAVEGALGEGLGKLYAERHFPAANKAAMDELVANLRKAMALNLDDLTWMSEATKVQARDKLAKFTPKIGYPEKFETYDALAVEPGKAFENLRASSRWAYADMIAKLGQPIDKTEWGMLPQTVNAYYSPNRNEIVFPAAILQPPFFNISADPAINYGGIGGVIGHEIGHGFDDQGSKSDGDGVLRNWWTPEDKAAFEALTGALVEQYNAFCPFEDACVNGRLALGENTGDLGGLSMAYRAYRLSLDKNADGTVSADEELPELGGFTGDQRFFLAWAQVWQSKYRDDAMRQQLQTGPHSPPYYRVNGIVRNFDEWYAAFNVQPGDALYLPPEQRIRIW
jgi:putative endopeptidase